jgi:hypothetical protein
VRVLALRIGDVRAGPSAASLIGYEVHMTGTERRSEGKPPMWIAMAAPGSVDVCCGAVQIGKEGVMAPFNVTAALVESVSHGSGTGLQQVPDLPAVRSLRYAEGEPAVIL